MAKDSKNKDVKNKRHFFKDFKAELKKVIWPTPKQVVNNTVAVIVIVLITALIVFVLDLCFDFINAKGINSLKAKIRNKNAVVQTVEQNGEAQENQEQTENNEEQQEPSTNEVQ